MTRDDAEVFAALLAQLAEVYDVSLTPTRTEMYFQALSDLPLGSMRQAVHHAVRESRYFPKPAELRDWADDDHTEAAELAWMALLEAFQDGYDGCALPDDPITQALVRVYWGTAFRAREWWRFCHDAALETKHREFVGRYEDYATRPEHELPRLPGGRVFLRAIEEARRAQISRGDRHDAGRPDALSLSGVPLDVGLRVATDPNGMPRATQASGAADAAPPTES